MLTFIKKFLFRPFYGILSLVIFAFLFSFILSNFIYQNLNLKLNYFLFFFLFLVFFFLLLELIFIILHYIKKGRLYAYAPKVKFEDIAYKGHPYIPYLLKEHAKGAPPTISIYPLHKNKYKFHRVKTNNMGFINGINGDRDVKNIKPDNVIRINCIGSSTTQNYLVYKDNVFSYPLELENELKNNKKIYEVNNCGQGGYNSADIMIRLLLQILDTNPDCIILYHGHADIRSYLSNDFKSDYSHSRYNLSEFYNKFKFNTLIPKMPFSFLNFLISKWFPYNFGISLVDLIHKQEIDLKLNPEQGLKTFERNLQFIIDVCNSRNIKLILSSYCHFLYDEVKDKALFKRYSEIMEMENDIIKKLAKKNSINFVDNASLIPKQEKYFVDTIHFSHEGMRSLAANFAKEIKSIYEK